MPSPSQTQTTTRGRSLREDHEVKQKEERTQPTENGVSCFPTSKPSGLDESFAGGIVITESGPSFTSTNMQHCDLYGLMPEQLRVPNRLATGMVDAIHCYSGRFWLYFSRFCKKNEWYCIHFVHPTVQLWAGSFPLALLRNV
jgi:hypothetical protein